MQPFAKATDVPKSPCLRAKPKQSWGLGRLNLLHRRPPTRARYPADIQIVFQAAPTAGFQLLSYDAGAKARTQLLRARGRAFLCYGHLVPRMGTILRAQIGSRVRNHKIKAVDQGRGTDADQNDQRGLDRDRNRHRAWKVYCFVQTLPETRAFCRGARGALHRDSRQPRSAPLLPRFTRGSVSLLMRRNQGCHTECDHAGSCQGPQHHSDFFGHGRGLLRKPPLPLLPDELRAHRSA